MDYKVSILVDGAFFLQRFKANKGVSPKIGDMKPFIDDIMDKVNSTQPSHTNTILRIYYYDCRPFDGKKIDPSGKEIDFSAHPSHYAANRFHDDLRLFPQMALRLGELSFDGWKVDSKDPSKYIPDLKQKAVDMKIGLDIAWMSSKKTVDKLVLVAGDSDFVSPMKLARKEGLLVYLYAMGQNAIKTSLKEHSDFII